MRLSVIAVMAIFFALFSMSAARAATPGEPAFRKASFTANYPAAEGFRLDFAADMAQCKARYGASWRAQCAASLGRPGDVAKGISLSPPLEGSWRWVGPSTLVFQPREAGDIRPGAEYRADWSGLFIPSFIKIDKSSARLMAPPLAARLVSSEFFINPAPGAPHRLAAALEFNYPVPENLEIRLSAPKGARFGVPEKVWNEGRLNISWPVSRLPAAPGQAIFHLPGFAEAVMADGHVRYRSIKDALSFIQNLPGSEGLFRIKKAALQAGTDDNLDRRIELVIESSLYARPDEVLRHLKVWELPRFNSPEGVRPYDWKAAPSISGEALNRSRQLEALPLATGNEPGSSFRFAIPARKGSYVLVGLDEGLPSASGQKLRSAWFDVLRADAGAPQLGFLQPGNILPAASGGKLDIYATDLECIRWRASMPREPFLALLAAESGDAFANPPGSSGLPLDSISVAASGEISLPKASPGKALFTTLDIGAILAKLSEGKGGRLAWLSLEGISEGKVKALASRLVLATDIGLLAKRGPTGAYECFAHFLSKGEPAAGATLSILGANGLPVASGQSDEKGHISFPSLAGLKREARPVALVAELAGDLAWLPLQDRSRELNYSDFETGGARLAPGGLNVFLFGQRGIYRPGENLDFGCMLRRADFSLAPDNLPLFAEILDPTGRRAWQGGFKSGASGLAEISWQSPPEAMSGRYTLNVRASRNGPILGSASARLEEFQPDTLKLKLFPPEVPGWLVADGSPAAIRLALSNLYGTPAKGHKLKASLETAPASFRFKGFGEFIFSDPAPFAGGGHKRQLPGLRTDANGEAIIDIPGEYLGRASARATIAAEGFDASGGRATVASTSFLVSPMPKLLGYRPLGDLTNMSFINKDARAEIELLALDSGLKPAAWDALRFTLSRRSLATNLVSDGSGGFRYDETPLSTPLKSWEASLPAGPRRIALDTTRPGEFSLTVRDREDRILADVPYAVAGFRPEPPDAPLAAGKMRMRLDRNEYGSGDEISVAISTPYDGFGLVSIEREGVAAFSWFSARAGDSVQKIKIPADFEGKGYVVISFIRSTASPDIYMRPHVFAAMPFLANMARRDIRLALEAPETVAPGQKLPLRLSAREKGKAILWAVDEGILQLTGYQSPKPLDGLLADRALDVAAIQAFDLLMPTHARLAPRLSAFGGGTDGAPFGARFQNPFKRRNEPPVVWWSGLIDVGPEPADLEIPIPSWYNGKLRLMAVAASAGAAGGVEAETSARAPLILSPQGPCVISPGDVFEMTLVLENSTDEPMAAHVTVEADPALTLEEEPGPDLKLPAASERTLSFRVRALDRPGACALRFSALANGREYSRDATFSLRPSSALRSSLLAGMLEKSGDIEVDRRVYKEGARSSASLSATPWPLARSFASYLDSYPYGCTEQLVSRSFAQILMRGQPWAKKDEKAREKLLSATLDALRSRFNGMGLSLWPEGEADLSLTAYAADFLLAMREAGLGGGEDILADLCEALEANCALNEGSLEAARASAYAIWVLTREGRITTQLIESLVDSLESRAVPGWKKDLAAALIAGSQREMHIRSTLPINNISYTSAGGFFDEYAQYALHMALLARYFPEKADAEARKGFYEASILATNARAFASFSASQGLRAIKNLAKGSALDIAGARLQCLEPAGEGGEAFSPVSNLLTYEGGRCSRYHIGIPEGSPPLFWQIDASGYDLEPPASGAASGIEISRRYLDAEGKPLGEFRQGDVVIAEIRARAQRPEIRDCVIVDLLPGGLEMAPARSGGEDRMPVGVKFIDRREDRMIIFADLTDAPLVFTYRLRAVGGGSFAAPAISAEAMYDQALYGHGEGGKLRILK